MKFTTIQPRLLSTADAGYYLGCIALLNYAEKGGWIKPSVHRRKMKFYDRTKLDLCADRFDAGEFPGE